MAVPAVPKSTVTLSSLIPRLQTKSSTIDPIVNSINSRGKNIDGNLARSVEGMSVDIASALTLLQKQLLDHANVLREEIPELTHLSIDSADIATLVVGGPDGPGELTVLGGPPDYEPLGFIGVRDSGNPITLTSIVAGLATTATEHGFEVGDHILQVGTTNLLHNGYFEVFATPSATTYTAIGMTGNSTGGTVTKQFQGGWLEMLAVGGDSPEDAPFFVDNNAQVVIGENGYISLRDLEGNQWGFLGVQTDAPKTVTGAVNNGSGLIRITVTTHGYITGDTIFVDNVGGVPNAEGDWDITVISANTFDLVGSTFAGTFTTGGTAIRHYSGLLAETIAIGDSFASYKLRGFRNGDLKIQNALITLTAGDDTITLNPVGPEITVFDDTTDWQVTIFGGAIDIRDTTAPAEAALVLQPVSAIIYNDSGNEIAKMQNVSNDGLIVASNSAGTLSAFLQGFDGSVHADGAFIGASIDVSGNSDANAFRINGTTIVNSSRDGTLNSLTLTTDLGISDGGTGAGTAAAARTNLDVYSKGEVDTLLAGKANASHSHTASTTGSHTHGGAVASDGDHSHSIT